MISRVECNSIHEGGHQGIRISFIFDGDEGLFDAFDFYEEDDIAYLTALMAMQVSPLILMVQIRDRMNVTVH